MLASKQHGELSPSHQQCGNHRGCGWQANKLQSHDIGYHCVKRLYNQQLQGKITCISAATTFRGQYHTAVSYPWVSCSAGTCQQPTWRWEDMWLHGQSTAWAGSPSASPPSGHHGAAAGALLSVSGLSHAYACINLSTSMPSALRSRTVVKSCRYEQHKISSGLVSAVCSDATCSGLEQCMVPAAPVQLHCSGSSACLDVLRSFASTARVCVPNTLSCSSVFSQTGATLEMKERVVVYSGASWPSATNDHQLDSHPCRLRYFSSSII